jgi:D-arabinose 1-dehydrogenase-like Zn-dependent alcohol dehydrogenase
MMCGGITLFSALRRFGAGDTARQVGVIGIGGLGHLAIQFAKAMGAEVTAISRGEAKKQEAVKLGSSNYIAVSDDVATSVKGHERTLDLVICCTGKSR